MASLRQIAANRANAQKSTGPRTTAGKAVSRKNAVKHGLQAELLVLPGESEEQFETLCQRVFNELEPVGIIEEQLTEDIACSFWRLRRARAAETGLYARLERGKYYDGPYLEDDLVLGLAEAFRSESLSRDVFGKFFRYQKSIENSFYRAMDKLKKLQADRFREEAETIDAVYEVEASPRAAE